MRNSSTLSEEKVRASIKEFIESLLGEEVEIDETIFDKPDIVFSKKDGTRIGVEITLLGYEKFMKWLSKGTTPGQRREANVVVDLERQITPSLKKKNKKYLDYRINRKLKEVWLCYHNDIYEFDHNGSGAQLDKSLFIADAWFYLKKIPCKFKKVIFFSENSSDFALIYDKYDLKFSPKPYKDLPVMKVIEGTFIMEGAGVTIDVTDPDKLQNEETFK
jgi:hypothetical protein